MSKYLVILRWGGTLIAIVAALLLASNIEASKYGFPLFLIAGTLWGIVAYYIKDYALLLLQVVFVAIDIYGTYQWVI